MRFLFFVALLLLAAVALFVQQNRAPVTVRFAFWSLETTVALAVIGAALLGGLIIYLASLFSLGDLRTRLRGMEARLRERERAAPGEGGQTPRS